LFIVVLGTFTQGATMIQSFAVRVLRRAAAAAFALVVLIITMSASSGLHSGAVGHDAFRPAALGCDDSYWSWSACDDGYSLSSSGDDSGPYSAYY